MPLAYVSNGEKVPLAVVKRIVIEVEEEVVFAFADPFDLTEVARLELRIEEDCLVVNVTNVEWLGRIYQFLWLEVRSHPLTFY